jgi:hypothetical protein
MVKCQLSLLPLGGARAPGPRCSAGVPLVGGHVRMDWLGAGHHALLPQRAWGAMARSTTGQHHKAQSPTRGQPGPCTGDQSARLKRANCGHTVRPARPGVSPEKTQPKASAWAVGVGAHRQKPRALASHGPHSACVKEGGVQAGGGGRPMRRCGGDAYRKGRQAPGGPSEHWQGHPPAHVRRWFLTRAGEGQGQRPARGAACRGAVKKRCTLRAAQYHKKRRTHF